MLSREGVGFRNQGAGYLITGALPDVAADLSSTLGGMATGG